MTADLVSFLRDRLAEDELPVVHERSCQSHTLMPSGSPLGLGGKPMTCNCIAVFRAWRCSKAKRRIVDHYETWQATLHETPTGWTAEGTAAYRMAM